MNISPKARNELFKEDPLSREDEIRVGSILKESREALIKSVVQAYYSGNLFAQEGLALKEDYRRINSAFGDEATNSFKKKQPVLEDAVNYYAERKTDVRTSLNGAIYKPPSESWNTWVVSFESVPALLYGIFPILDQIIALAKDVERDASTKLVTLEPPEIYLNRSAEVKRNLKLFLESRQQLIMHNMRFISMFRKRSSFFLLDDATIIEDGYAGLERATHTYVPERGKFISHAESFIRSYLLRKIAEVSVIPIPHGAKDKASDVFKVKEELEEQLGYTPSPELIAAELNISESMVKGLLGVQKQVSLDASFSDSEGSLYDVLPDTREVDVSRSLISDDFKQNYLPIIETK